MFMLDIMPSYCTVGISVYYIEDIHFFLLNMAFISSSEVENISIS